VTALAAGPSHALLADGTTIEIRPAEQHDAEAVLRFHQAMSADNRYLRFFSLSKLAAGREAQRISRPAGPDHAALLAELDGRVVGVASYEPAPEPGVAEVAFAVADAMHGRGVATLLLEHLVSIGRARQVEAFQAQTLPDNTAMLGVFAEAGLPVRRRLVDNVVELTMPIPRAPALTEASTYLDAVAHRESLADVESLRPLLAPRSVVVVGASRRPETVGRSILENIVAGGYAGPVYAVNPHASELAGVPCLPAVSDLPHAPDLAVVAVPAATVPAVAEECGQRGIRAIVVITSGLEPAQGRELLAACRRHSMRLVGPNCFGIAVPGLGLNATFAAFQPAAGTAGLVMQSGGLGLALLNHLTRLGVGISSFASVGNKYDVSGNDMLTWWEQDRQTRLAVLYMESFGNPRKFARTARRVGRTMPVLTVYAGRTEAGQRAAATHSAAAAAPLVSREALFQQAGVIATESFGELLDTIALLASQPVPTGPRVAVISNAGGAGVLAADACVESGLRVGQPSGAVENQLRQLIPPGGAFSGPVDTTAAIAPAGFCRCLELVASDAGVDAVLALVLPTATSDLLPAVLAAHVPVPLALVVLDQPEAVRLVARGDATADPATARQLIPAYAYPESAARALAQAVRYGRWRARPPASSEPLPGLRRVAARDLVTGFLARLPGGGWLPAEAASDVLACYGIQLTVAAPGGGTGDGGAPGTALTVAVRQDPVFGPLVVLRPGGAASELPGGYAARLAPLTAPDADDLIHSLRAAPLLLGERGTAAVDVAALREVLLRVSRLADDLPQVAELTLDPVAARPDGVSVQAARARLSCREAADPFLRQLRPFGPADPPPA
jgi:acyl-CoA synthetase (NDP forming)/GNAT superfamily N-acetyltransferase